jgi:hypothetical protein
VALALLIVLSLLAIGIYFAVVRRPAAETLLAEIDRHAADPMTVDDAIENFLKWYPEHERGADVAELARIADAMRLRNQLSLRRRFSRSLTPIEQQFQELTDFDSPTDVGELESMVAYYESLEGLDENARGVVAAAKAYLVKYRRDIARQTSVDRPQIEQALGKAESASDPEMARAIYQWIVKYYGDKPWAQDLVERARAKIQ